MSDTTADKVKLIAPELSEFICGNDNLVDLILEDVAGQINSATYGSKQERAQRYLAAHFLSLAFSSSQGVGGSGPIESEKVGDVEVKYGKVDFADKSRYDETPYGRTYKVIKSSSIGAFMTITP